MKSPNKYNSMAFKRSNSPEYSTEKLKEINASPGINFYDNIKSVSKSYNMNIFISRGEFSKDYLKFGTLDPYFIMNINNNIYKSDIAYQQGLMPIWDYALDNIEITSNINYISIKCYDYNTNDDIFIGECQITLTDIINKAYFKEKYIDLKITKKTTSIMTGKLYIKIIIPKLLNNR